MTSEYDFDDEETFEEELSDIPEGAIILEIFTWDNALPLASKIVLALLKLHPELVTAVPMGALDPEQKVIPFNKATELAECEICGKETLNRFYLSMRVKFVLCKPHALRADALVVFNRSFFTKKNLINLLRLDMTSELFGDELTSSV